MFLDGALYYKSRLYVSEPARQDLVCSLHCSLAGGYGGYFHTVHLVQHDYWWPGLTTFVRRFVAGCTTCQANKVNTHPTVPGALFFKHGFARFGLHDKVILDRGPQFASAFAKELA